LSVSTRLLQFHLSQSFSILFFTPTRLLLRFLSLACAASCKVKINSFALAKSRCSVAQLIPGEHNSQAGCQGERRLVIKVKRLHVEKLCSSPSGRATQVAYLLMLDERGVIAPFRKTL